MAEAVCEEAEQLTKQQSECAIWHELRYGRITASKFYEAAHCKTNNGSLVQQIIGATIKQAFIAHAELLKKNREKSPNLTCEHCPMLWYHRLCTDIEGMNEKKAHAFILRRMEQLPEFEQDQIITKYQVGTNHMYEVGEHNAFLMILLRAHCESKQQRHVHDTAENRSEFLNQYLGGSTIFMKAKRSLSSGFDHLLKRRSSRDDINAPVLPLKKEPSPKPMQETSSESIPSITIPPNASRQKSQSPGIGSSDNNEASPTPHSPAADQETPTEEDAEIKEIKQESTSNTPMIDINANELSHLYPERRILTSCRHPRHPSRAPDRRKISRPRFAGVGSNAVYEIVTGDCWIYCYDPEAKRLSAQWVCPSKELPFKIKRWWLSSKG
ncbi:TBC1 domain family member 4 [Eumeta japonica]|uniref:TBC1 domain family member 4 n=1 Tax=Eumeta variegata TaxID=151549 RepID=A0A4C1XVN8_EUMVA|nr:TBC1 domain family member 4 [Eumeta japonica]